MTMNDDTVMHGVAVTRLQGTLVIFLFVSLLPYLDPHYLYFHKSKHSASFPACYWYFLNMPLSDVKQDKMPEYEWCITSYFLIIYWKRG